MSGGGIVVCVGDPAVSANYISIIEDRYEEWEEEIVIKFTRIDGSFMHTCIKKQEEGQWAKDLYHAKKQLTLLPLQSLEQGFIRILVNYGLSRAIRRYAKKQKLNWKDARFAVEDSGVILLIYTFLEKHDVYLDAQTKEQINKAIYLELPQKDTAYDKTSRVRSVITDIIYRNTGIQGHENSKEIGSLLSGIRLYFSYLELNKLDFNGVKSLYDTYTLAQNEIDDTLKAADHTPKLERQKLLWKKYNLLPLIYFYPLEIRKIFLLVQKCQHNNPLDLDAAVHELAYLYVKGV